MTRSGTSFGLAIEDRDGMGPCPSVDLSIRRLILNGLRSARMPDPSRLDQRNRAIPTKLQVVLSYVEITSQQASGDSQQSYNTAARTGEEVVQLF